MDKPLAKPRDIDEYIARAPADVQAILQIIRATIRKAAPKASEVISYQMPAFKQHGNLVYFAAFKHHIGFFPPVSGPPALKIAIAKYAGPKGNLQFPLSEPMPLGLITRIVKERLRADAAHAKAKQAGKADKPATGRAKPAQLTR